MSRSDVARFVRVFHRTFRLPMSVAAYWPELVETRRKLVVEEALEAADELLGPTVDLPRLAKELADAAYVLYGTALTFGIDLDEAIECVHRSNMTKLGADGQPIYRHDGKVLKGPNYRPADVSSALPLWWHQQRTESARDS